MKRLIYIIALVAFIHFLVFKAIYLSTGPKIALEKPKIPPVQKKLAVVRTPKLELKNLDLNSYSPTKTKKILAHNYTETLYCLPFASGQQYLLTQGPGGNTHQGYGYYAFDFNLPEGTPVHAARTGKVLKVVQNLSYSGKIGTGFQQANHILIVHRDGTMADYAHLKKNGARVKLNQIVKTGDLIGISGNTGYSSGPHLHFAVSKKFEDGFQNIPIKFNTAAGVIAKFHLGQSFVASELCYN